ncbi:CinA family nicotinamide mononucleotide deamidase-related protein [Planctomicrobium piriforme]|uniref:CinA-like protein n=1 Tax=Planctomicrobium piriforme TaxID=1576369 RepID=A0A1I3TBT4_9PLAN|nr:CinA family nicotinamide mononucleotide deamidase-related protein [Planctomicrobium piriforme]SFJ68574.1 nicotinamide-nucleotide amidase [Planctomicrobium piriforme]
MQAEIIAIGTEITSGAKLDTNSQWLSLQLAEIGISTVFHTTVADSLQANVDVLRIARDRADVVLITGGLGPTLDDLTREAMAAMAGVELVLHQPSLDLIEKFFRSRGREMPARNRIQAMFPAGSTPLVNPIGTAPGVWQEATRADGKTCVLAAMPGVPSEMKKMFFEQVRPRLQGDGLIIRRARINCYGLGESQAEEMLGDLTARGHDPEIGITAHEATITLRIIAEGRTEAECQEKIAMAAAAIRERLGEYVFGIEDEELEHIVVRDLTAAGQTFATIECATGGLLAQRIAHVQGAGVCYRGGIVLPRLGGEFEAVAQRVREESHADWILVVGPETSTVDSDRHTLSDIPLALYGDTALAIRIDLKWSGNPAITKSRACKSALDLLRRRLAHTAFNEG